MFYPIAIRVLSDDCIGRKKLSTGVFYYFIKGYNISEDASSIKVDRSELEENIYNCDAIDGSVHVSFSALVGENGSGKSTLIELFIRIINNFSASVFGEYAERANEAHLHYIDGLACELYYRKQTDPFDEIYRILIQNRCVETYVYLKNDDAKEEVFTLKGDDPMKFILFSFASDETPFLPNKGLKEKDFIENFSKKIFYTYVSNYSLYAYRCQDFLLEANPTQYESKCRKVNPKQISFAQRHWFEGLFHRNELYQKPCLLYPSRELGNIKISEETDLAYARFLSAILSKKSSYREINDHLTVTGLVFGSTPYHYNVKYINQKTDYHFVTAGYDKLRHAILLEWSRISDCDLQLVAGSRRYGEDALDYLVYKTLKISCHYPSMHRWFYNSHKRARSKIQIDQLKQLILQIAKDSSHLSRKLRQTLIYLKFGLYDYETQKEISVDVVSDDCEKVLRQLYKPAEAPFLLTLRAWGIEDLTPPPFIFSDVVIRDNAGKVCPFNTVSSGEKQFIFSLTGILSHLINLDSVDASSYSNLITYSDVNIILEELELYFHPDLQRRLVNHLRNGLRQCKFRHIKNVHFLMVTHSPFVLSDIIAKNVLILQKDGLPASDIHYQIFGANIHEILRHPFFLKNGAMGEFAKVVVNQIATQIEENNDVNLSPEAKERLLQKIYLIDEPILRKILLDQYHRKYGTPQSEVALVEAELQRLQQYKESLLNN
ncbi:hypothetical protein F070042J6_29400 [Bacteroides sp. f07]|uniref:AAA family ATPase n=1 Tax=Bacteroides sp. f07 TaxID=3132704 RepID=UPI0034B1116C